jgi:formate dehydrogenase iron-sulfur subunit
MTAVVAVRAKKAPARGLLIDITRCIGCRACASACKESHGFPGDGTETELDAVTYTVVLDKGEDRYLRRMCMHCVDPSCASACPVGAFQKTALGPVTYEAAKCLGCRYCMVACPFGVPKYEWRSAAPVVRKCDLCADRLASGQVPACVEACPAEATVEGPREELLAEAHRRIAENPGQYHPVVYGEHEVGGTSVLFLSPVPFEALGFKTLGHEPLPNLTWAALQKVPGVLSIGGAGLFAVWWITHRRDEVAQAAARAASPAAPADGGDR